MVITNIDYTYRRDIHYIEYSGLVSFYSSKEIDWNKPFSVAIIDVLDNYVVSIYNIWLTSYDYKAFDNGKCFVYSAQFQASNITRGNLKTAYIAFLKK